MAHMKFLWENVLNILKGLFLGNAENAASIASVKSFPHLVCVETFSFDVPWDWTKFVGPFSDNDL